MFDFCRAFSHDERTRSGFVCECDLRAWVSVNRNDVI